MKNLLLLGFALLGICACNPSSNPINNDPYGNIKEEKLNLNIAASVEVPRKGGLVEIPVEYEGEYEIKSNSYDVQVVRSKAMQKGTILLSVTSNLGDASRTMEVDITYVSATTTYPGGSTSNKSFATKRIQITQEPVAKEVLLADITQATSLYVAASSSPSGVASKAASSAQKLYKIAATGAVDSVVFKDEYGDTATVAINYIRNLSDKYVYMNLIIEPRNIEKQYVVRKTDGAVFAAKPPYIEKTTEVQTDHRQNIYYQSNYNLYKMYDYNKGVDVAQLTKDYMSVSRYMVDAKGNVAFDYRNTVSGASEPMCYIASGEFSRLSHSASSLFVLKKEAENFYYLESDVYHSRKCQLWRVRATLPATTTDILVDGLKYNGTVVNWSSSSSRFVLDNMTLLIGQIYDDSYPYLLQIQDEQNYKLVQLSRPWWPEALKGGYKSSGDYLYGFNKDEIYRINIHTGDVEVLYANNEYSIYDFSVGADNVLTFSALELRKAQDVVCEIRNGQLKVLKTDDSQKIIQLERIN